MKNYTRILLLLLLTTVISFVTFAKANQSPYPTSGNGPFVKTIYASVVDGGAK